MRARFDFLTSTSTSTSQELRRAAEESKTAAAALAEQLDESQERLALAEREKVAALTSLAATRIALSYQHEVEGRVQVSEATVAALTEQLADCEDRLARALSDKVEALAALAAARAAPVLDVQQARPASTAKPPAAATAEKRRKPGASARAGAAAAPGNRPREPPGKTQATSGAPARAAAAHAHRGLTAQRTLDDDSAESLSDSSLDFKRQPPKFHKGLPRGARSSDAT